MTNLTENNNIFINISFGGIIQWLLNGKFLDRKLKNNKNHLLFFINKS